MGSLWYKNKFKLSVPLILALFCLFIPSLVWSAGFHEEKLFDSEFYSPEELVTKIEAHNREIQVLDNTILSLEKDIDWVVLKINQIKDSGRTAASVQEKSVSRKTKTIQALEKSRNRLENLVKYYSSMLEAYRETGIEDISKKKVSSHTINKKSVIQKKISAVGKESALVKPAPLSQKAASSVQNPLKQYGVVSKAKLQAAIHQSGIGDWVEIVGTGTCLKLEITLPILFPSGSAKVAREYTSFFNRLAEFLKPYDVKVFVAGYADKVPIKNKTYPSNFELGATRAANIVHQLVNSGLKPSIFKIESTGRYRFAAKQISKQNSIERRAEVTIVFSS